MSNLQIASQKLNDAQLRLLRTADAIDSSLWNTCPGVDSWSAAQVVAHLCQVERTTLGYADRVVRKTARPVTFFQRFHLPIALVESRIIKRKSPFSVEPEMLAGKETMLAELRGVRERTLAFLDETQGRDLRCYRWPHPFLGPLNFYEWFTFLAAHQVRHTKQMVEIAQNLPKRVLTS